MRSPRSQKRFPGLAVAALASLAAAGAVSVDNPGSAHAARSDYVGVSTCAGCHEQAYQVWQAGPHARADAVLGANPEPRCLGCHTTGEAPAGKPYFAGVQCEACHGPGAGYAEDDIMRNPVLSRHLGLRDLSTPAAREALCAECHRAFTRLEPFSAADAWKRIEHR